MWWLWIFRKFISFYPEESFEIKLKMSREEAIQKIMDVTKLMSWRTSWLSTSQLFYGKFHKDGFRIRPAFGFPYSNYIIPVIKGLFVEKKDGLAILIKLEKPHEPDMVRFTYFLFIMLILPILIIIPALIFRWDRHIVSIVEILAVAFSFIAFGMVISNSFARAKKRLYNVLGLKEPLGMKWE